ncbi:hypothetical protein [uncultured Gammaproteobacteria bacterium]|nr:hypothetical protein [uncultured Gammaproteobacteria bacterium]
MMTRRKFLSHLCGGKYIVTTSIIQLSFLSHLCGGKYA